MTRQKDYLDAVAVTGFFTMFGPFVFQVILFILTGNSIPPNLDQKDVLIITYIGGFFFFTGLQMLLFVVLMRVVKRIK
jgi:hypothetical protein